MCFDFFYDDALAQQIYVLRVLSVFLNDFELIMKSWKAIILNFKGLK